MFDIGFSELFLVLVIALIVIGPERLPAVASKLGKFLGKAKRSFENIKREVQSEFETEELNKRMAEKNILGDVKDSVENAIGEVKDSVNNILGDVKGSVDDVSEELKEIAKKAGEKTPETKDWKNK